MLKHALFTRRERISRPYALAMPVEVFVCIFGFLERDDLDRLHLAAKQLGRMIDANAALLPKRRIMVAAVVGVLLTSIDA